MASIPDPGNITRRQASPEGGAAPSSAGASSSLASSIVLPLYFVVTLMPIALTVASLRLSPLRVLLLVLFLPYLVRILRGMAGRVTSVDILMLCHAAWIVIALMVVHGMGRLPFAGITMVELVGGYLLGRVLIRNSTDYRRMIRYFLYGLIFLFPFALAELFTGRLIIPDLVRPVFETFQRGWSAYGRWGMERVYAVFDHPILFGMFCSLGIANLYYISRSAGILRLAGMLFAAGMTFMSLSSAPLLACGLQFGMLVWDKITRGSWKLFVILGIIGYVTVDALSNRTPVTILIETMTFNSGTGWIRIAIFEFGIQNAYANPIFGIGFNDWERPFWLTGSVDNFWLLTTMRYGFPGVALLILAFVAHLLLLIRSKIRDPDAIRLRTGYAITFVATCFTMVTVHLWGAVGVFAMFYLGAGSWFYTNPQITRDPDEDTPREKAGAALPAAGRHSRFPVRDTAANRKRADRA